MEPTKSVLNFERSVKRHFIEKIQFAHGVKVVFGDSSAVPEDEEQWVTVSFGRGKIGGLSNMILNVFPCVREDSSGSKLSELTDLVFECMTDHSSEKSNSILGIPLYDTRVDPWEQVSTIMFNPISSADCGEILTASDRSKFRMMVVTTNFFTK